MPLDIFRKIQHNKNIRIESRLEAWLTFLCMDEPDAVISIIEKYPDFRAMYDQIYDICQNIEEVMGMFSKELRDLELEQTRQENQKLLERIAELEGLS